jgi:hypothetical protein
VQNKRIQKQLQKSFAQHAKFNAFKLPEPKPLLTLYGAEGREVFVCKEQKESEQVEEQKQIQEAITQLHQERYQ